MERNLRISLWAIVCGLAAEGAAALAGLPGPAVGGITLAGCAAGAAIGGRRS